MKTKGTRWQLLVVNGLEYFVCENENLACMSYTLYHVLIFNNLSLAEVSKLVMGS
jgi:hypothetical protein